MRTRFRMAMSRAVGWWADRKVPTKLRGPVYRGFARVTGADLDEARKPLSIYPTLGAFFVRRLIEGARPIDADPRAIVSPVDGRVHTTGAIDGETVLQAKGRPYSVRDLLAGVGEEVELDGGHAWTLYLGPRDYHRIHAPEAGELRDARWVPGARYSVAPDVLARRMVLPINERCVLRLETTRGPLFLVLVGALNVGRIRVVGVDPAAGGAVDPPRRVERGDEVARFELGSTVVIVTPPGMAASSAELAPGTEVRLGKSIGSYLEA